MKFFASCLALFKSDCTVIAPLVGSGGTNNQVPEPFTLSLFGAGLAGVVAMRRRKAKV